jgi:hypothetical protein
MTFEDLVVPNVDQLPEGHPAHYLEFVVKGILLKKKADHDAEHVAMMKHWNYDVGDEVDYNLINVRNGSNDRMWHIALHLRYWKEKELNNEYVKEFEEKFPNINLEEIPLP